MSFSTSEEACAAFSRVLMKDPQKRALLQKLLSQTSVEKSKNVVNSSFQSVLSPNHKVWNSPTMLHRKRALARLNREPSPTTSTSNSEIVENNVSISLPNNKLLKGVVGYVEIKQKDMDRSDCVKILMSGMGAVIRDTFTSDVTHVIFKDGSFTTFQKAKLMRVHLLSPLWLEAVRRHKFRVPEKKYPAFGMDCYSNISQLCSQIQEDYEDVIQEEVEKSFLGELPPFEDSNDCKSSDQAESFKTAKNLFSNDTISSFLPPTHSHNSTPQMTSDNSNEIDRTIKPAIVPEEEEQASKNNRRRTLYFPPTSDFKPTKKSSRRTTMTRKKIESNEMKTSKTCTLSSKVDFCVKHEDKENNSKKKNAEINAEMSENDSTNLTNASSSKNHSNLHFTRSSNSKSPKQDTKTVQKKITNNNSSVHIENNDFLTDKSPTNSPKRKENTSKINSTLSKKIKVLKNLDGPSIETVKSKDGRTKRMLYNSNQSLPELTRDLLSSDEKERNHKREKAKKNGVILKPIVVTPAAAEVIQKTSKSYKTVVDEYLDSVNTVTLDSVPKTLSNQKTTTKDPTYHTKSNVYENVTRRKSLRITMRQNYKLDSSSKTESDLTLSISPIARRSSPDFQFSSNEKKKNPKKPIRLPTIVCTKCHRQEVETFTQVVKKIGGFEIQDEVSRRTTHLIVGESKRTINMLRALARGCWILRMEWIFRSLGENQWLPEDDYEANDFSPAVKQSREKRQEVGASYTMDLFENCGRIYIAKSTTPRCSDLRELVLICKGTITTIIRNADIVVGEYHPNIKSCVNEKWIMDSITLNKLQSTNEYVIKK